MVLWEVKFWHLQQAGVKQNLVHASELTVTSSLRVSGSLTINNEVVSESLGNHLAPTARQQNN